MAVLLVYMLKQRKTANRMGAGLFAFLIPVLVAAWVNQGPLAFAQAAVFGTPGIELKPFTMNHRQGTGMQWDAERTRVTGARRVPYFDRTSDRRDHAAESKAGHKGVRLSFGWFGPA
jgi:hypothetical protein